LLADAGVENFNGAVEELIHSGLLHRVLARTEITYSNSMIESWWRVLKHQWLYLNTLDSVNSMRHMGRSPLAPAASGATGNRRLEARIDTRSHPNRRWNPLGCGVADGSATTVATTRAEKCRMS
jgi:hypothetical protein